MRKDIFLNDIFQILKIAVQFFVGMIQRNKITRIDAPTRFKKKEANEKRLMNVKLDDWVMRPVTTARELKTKEVRTRGGKQARGR